MHRLHTLLRPFVLFALVLSLATCKGVEPTYYQPKPVDDWRPRVLKATLSGVPDQAIAVDTANRTITVTLPENYSVLRADLNLTLSCDSCMIGYVPKTTTLRVFFPDLQVYPERPAGFELRRVGYNEPTRYTLFFKPTGPLQISPLAEPLVAERGGEYTIPISVSNYLDGFHDSVMFTNKATGEVSDGLINFCANTRDECPEERANRVWITVGNLLPGEYTVRLVKTGGREAVVNQPLLVRRGKIQLENVTTIVAGAQMTRLYGLNLYTDNRPELLVSNATGYSIRLPISKVSENSEQAEAILPSSIPPGYYRAQLTESSGQLSAVRGFIIQRTAQQPYVINMRDSLTTFYYSYQPSQTTNPIEFVVNRNIYIDFSHLSLVRKHQIRLTPVEGGRSSVLIDILIDRSYYLAGPDSGTFPTFRLPNTLQPGRYKLTVLVYKDETTFDESEPLERDILLR